MDTSYNSIQDFGYEEVLYREQKLVADCHYNCCHYNHRLLSQVYALDKPEELGGEERMIGELVLTSNLTTSKWGDTGLFFRHQE